MPLSPEDRERYHEEVAAVALADKRDVMLMAIEAYVDEASAQSAILSGESAEDFRKTLLDALHDAEGDFLTFWIWDAWERCGEMDARRKREKAEQGDEEDD